MTESDDFGLDQLRQMEKNIGNISAIPDYYQFNNKTMNNFEDSIQDDLFKDF